MKLEQLSAKITIQAASRIFAKSSWHLYCKVVTASQAELATLPKKTDERAEEDVIPKRNRGRVQKKKIDYYQDNNINDDEKERFREWKRKNKFKPSETGLFRKWKKEIQRGRNKPSRISKSFESSEDDNDLEEEYTEKKGKYKKKIVPMQMQVSWNSKKSK